MTKDEIIAKQKTERQKCLEVILNSSAQKKIIVAGAGTGKTFTFSQVLSSSTSGQNIALTFIRILSEDMHISFGHLAEVKTFHAYCKKILHEQNGRVELNPILSSIIEEDAQLLDLSLKDFDTKFQILDEGPEIQFYLKRGDYYSVVSFNDSVYRLYKLLQTQPDIIPTFNNILVDEYQDFNPLEVAFINELEKKGNVLIVGDDDQAVYDGRGASPNHLRYKYNSGEYELFELPFCSRCPDVIVKAINVFLDTAEKLGFLNGRIKKRYECFLEAKLKDDIKFPKIITVQCTVVATVAKYIESVIDSIDEEDIAESWKDGSEYPTVLIVGPKQYLTNIQNKLSKKYPQMNYKLKEEGSFSVVDGYNLLLGNQENNLGWRILIDFYFQTPEIKSIIEQSENGRNMMELLDNDFIISQRRAIEIIQFLRNGNELTKELNEELKSKVENYHDEIIDYYSPKAKEEKDEPDKTKPSVLLTSFVGCKGLSAGHVIIVGANNGSLPKDVGKITDVEICQFLVALTRTRKQCHIVSNKWLVSPKSKSGYNPVYKKSFFLSMIPPELIEDKGYLTSKEL